MSLWYVMQVRAGTEENARCQCLRLISSNILEHCFVPYYQQKKRFQGEWHIQETVLFPGYVFLVTSDLKQLMDSLRKVTGMIRLLRTGEQIDSSAVLCLQDDLWMVFLKCIPGI